MKLPKEIQELSESLASLPGVGPKLSGRLALYLAVNGKRNAINIKDSINSVLNNITVCKNCGNVATKEFCDICSSENRDDKTILVVEDALDLYNIESTGEYRGLYHVLNGVISPINGVSASDINLDSLFKRIKKSLPEEIILALNPNVEGDSTSMYILNEINKMNINLNITRLAKGIPVGSDLEYVSTQTIIDSMKSRTKFVQ